MVRQLQPSSSAMPACSLCSSDWESINESTSATYRHCYRPRTHPHVWTWWNASITATMIDATQSAYLNSSNRYSHRHYLWSTVYGLRSTVFSESLVRVSLHTVLWRNQSTVSGQQNTLLHDIATTELVNGQRSTVNGQRSTVNGQRSTVTVCSKPLVRVSLHMVHYDGELFTDLERRISLWNRNP